MKDIIIGYWKNIWIFVLYHKIFIDTYKFIMIIYDIYIFEICNWVWILKNSEKISFLYIYLIYCIYVRWIFFWYYFIKCIYPFIFKYQKYIQQYKPNIYMIYLIYWCDKLYIFTLQYQWLIQWLSNYTIYIW